MRKVRGKRRRRGKEGADSPLETIHQRCDTHIFQCPMKRDAGRPHAHQLKTIIKTHASKHSPGPDPEEENKGFI